MQAIGSSKLLEPYADKIKLEVRRFLLRLFEEPGEFLSHIRRYAAAGKTPISKLTLPGALI